MKKSIPIATLVLAAMSLFAGEVPAMAASHGNESIEPRSAVATLGGGCFWCLEAVFEELAGVEDVISGYAGGVEKNPDYRSVCAGLTGHAEVVQIRFDKSRIGYDELLAVFFGTHDPTTLDRQGADIGSQYRSVILYHDETQRETAEAMIAELEERKVFDRRIVTEVAAMGEFYPAEAYHQDYFSRNSDQPYCAAVISPKLDKFRKDFAGKLSR